MNSQIKYVLQGVLLTLLTILAFRFILLVSAIHFVEPHSAVNDYNNVTESSEKIIDNAFEGQKIFSANCASCHAINKRLTGPALAGFEQRGPWKDRKQVYAWIRNPVEYMKKNRYAKQLYEEYQVMMSPFPELTDQEIDAIIECINHRVIQYELPMAIDLKKKRL